ncbi:GrpB family protein [Thalassotalea sp. M1531]|uniref:GrpB family protein n=1 Tax=Thalassotalea algicola TaxID=2716224 RepID=A0A7Y0Q6F0_9GAMM|nr:GrpB family protein [Thalassotalea algicola]NMP30767.1 GrpB family protein [Thalassotalea algicola]
MYLFPHDNKWTAEFEKEKNSIISAYGAEIEIYHIGSTAIKGLYAKNCLDLLGVVEKISEVSTLKQSIINLGYDYKGEYGISGREYFSKKQRKVHLHIFQIGDANVQKHLNFVKVMKGNKELITELNQVKQNLHAKYPNDKESYQKEKEFFYNRINKVL